MLSINKFINDSKNLDYESFKKKLIDKNLLIKESDNLFLINYDSSKEKDEITNSCRSIILDKNNYTIKMLGLLGKISYEEFINKVSWNDLVIEESIDGTLINLYYDNEWKISTKKTINGDCYWNTKKTFKELFMEIINKIEFNFNILNKSFCYSFVLCHPESRNIIKYNEPKIFHILSRNLINMREIDEDIGIPKPAIIKLNQYNISGCNNYTDLLEKLNNLENDTEGYMLYSKDRKYRTKLISTSFQKKKNIKGNYYDINLKLLEIRNDYNKLKEFLDIFPEYIDILSKLEIKIYKLAKIILNYYTNVRIKKINTIIPDVYKKIIYELHGIYIKNKKPITQKKVIEQLCSYNFIYINYLLKSIET